VAIAFFINSIFRNTMRLVPIIELLPVGGPSRALTVHGQSIFEYLLAIAVAISFFINSISSEKKCDWLSMGARYRAVARQWLDGGPSVAHLAPDGSTG